MNRKITRLARAAKCGNRGARGSAGASLAVAVEVEFSSDAKAMAPNPTDDCCRAWRRVSDSGEAGCMAGAARGETRRDVRNYR
jgi:hypothetical protein